MNINKKLPIILIAVGLIVVLGAVLLVKGLTNKKEVEFESEEVAEIPVGERPATILIPSKDGHELNLKITGIKVKGVSTLDYELLYKVADGRTQGVPGTIKLNGQTGIERNLLLGSESAGKKRYDEGVETGTLTLRFRDAKGKLLGRLSTDFHLQTNTTQLSSNDNSFKYVLDKLSPKVFFITMQSFAEPNSADVVIFSNGYAVMASDGLPHSGRVN